MGIADALGISLRLREALVLAGAVALLGTFIAMPKILRKLRGAGIVGRDINKPDRPVVPEMGGLGVFLGTYTGVFAFLLAYPLTAHDHIVVLVALITAAGAAMTGILDDLVQLRQRFKAFIPVVFAMPLAVYLTDYTIWFPLVGNVDFGLFYPLVLVPLGVASAANSFNMLEGYNGLGTSLGILIALAMALLVVLSDHPAALVLLVPLIGSLLAFLWFNKYPARVFPGDTMTLFVGAMLASAAMIGKVEFWGALLFAPHILEFVVKGLNKFPSRGWGGMLRDGKLYCPPHGPVGLGQWAMKLSGGITEPQLVGVFLAAEGVLVTVVLASAYAL